MVLKHPTLTPLSSCEIQDNSSVDGLLLDFAQLQEFRRRSLLDYGQLRHQHLVHISMNLAIPKNIFGYTPLTVEPRAFRVSIFL